MSAVSTPVAARLFALGAVIVGAALAWTFGGRDDDHAPPPLPPPSGAANAPGAALPGSKGARATEDFVTVERLVTRLQTATIDAPNLKGGEALALTRNWRRMGTPWVDLTGAARQVAVTMALAENEKEAKAVPLPTGAVWQPDAHTWNMNEGAFSARDTLFAPTPATLTFAATLPAHARLLVSTGLAAASRTPVIFTVAARDAGEDGKPGPERTLFEETRAANDAGTWREATIDLSAVAERPVELSFRTRSAKLESKVASAAPATSEPIALAAWGDPQIQAPASAAPVDPPYNVLWIVVDALRPDVLAAMHDDEDERREASAPYPIGDALLPRMPGLLPNLEALAARGVRFTRAYSAATWTRPGTLAMLSGARPSELGTQTLSWLVSDPEAARYYATQRPLFPHLAATHGLDVRAFVNNYFMTGYAPVGLDMGFPSLDDHRYPLRDTQEIERDAEAFLASHAGERFFAFCNFNSPHEPYDPPPEFEARVPPAPAGPTDPQVRRYVAEAAKDDEAIGQLVRALSAAKIDDRTIIVVTADHGETLSAAHGGTSELDHQAIRFHHSASNYEETTHVPLLLVLPGVLPANVAVKARVRTTDIAPTLLDLEGMGELAAAAKMSGRSLLPLARGQTEADERPVVSEGRGSRAILAGKWHLVTREGATRITHFGDRDVTLTEELFDLDADPGERHDVAREHPDAVAEMRARLAAALANAPVAGSASARDTPPADAADRTVYRFRFAGGGAVHRVSGTVHMRAVDPTAAAVTPALVPVAVPVGVAPEALRVVGTDLEISLSTAPDAVVGFDLEVRPPDATVTWDLFEDDQPWPAVRAYAGPFGLPSPVAVHGQGDPSTFLAAEPAFLDPSRDRGLFVTSASSSPGGSLREAPARPSDPRATGEMSHMLEQWGYAHGTAAAVK